MGGRGLQSCNRGVINLSQKINNTFYNLNQMFRTFWRDLDNDQNLSISLNLTKPSTIEESFLHFGSLKLVKDISGGKRKEERWINGLFLMVSYLNQRQVNLPALHTLSFVVIDISMELDFFFIKKNVFVYGAKELFFYWMCSVAIKGVYQYCVVFFVFILNNYNYDHLNVAAAAVTTQSLWGTIWG